MARSRLAFRDSFWWSRRVSTIWVEIRKKGLRLVMGSWKIMEIFAPRISRSRFPLSLKISAPWNSTSPPTIFPGGLWTRFMMERFVTDFPEPDSPTMPITSPFLREKDTPSTAFTTPSSVKKWVLRPLTSRTVSSALSITSAIVPPRALKFRGGHAPLAPNSSGLRPCGVLRYPPQRVFD